MRINTNIPSLNVQRQMSQTTQAISRALARLSSGRRINEGRDDAAGLAISENLSAQVRGMRQIALNINQAFGYLQTADGVLQTQTEIVQRMRELALQGANGTLSLIDRQNLEIEMLALYEEFERVSETANFNGSSLLDGSFGTISIQVGLQKGQTIDFNLTDSRGSAIFTHAATIGTGAFTQNQTITMSFPYYYSWSGDVDGDGDTDFVHEDPGGVVDLYRQNSSGNFIAERLQTTSSVQFGDLNDDGLVDYIDSDGIVASVYFQNASGSFTRAQTLATNAYTLRDFDNDGDLDFITHFATNISVSLNDGNGRFTNTGPFNFGTNPARTDLDINNDGILDAYSLDGVNNRVIYALGTASGSFSAVQTMSLGAGYTSIRFGDFNGDDIQDVVGLHASSGAAVIRMGSADGTFSVGQTLSSALNYSGLWEAEDVNNDGFEDLFFLNDAADSVAVRLSDGNGNFSVGTTISLPAGYGNASFINSDHFADLDNDGNIDLISATTNLFAIQWGDGSGGFSGTSTLALNNTQYYSIRDLNNDGRLDIFSQIDSFPASQIPANFALLNADRTFSTHELSRPDAYAAQIADYNSDGALDYLLSEDGNFGPNAFVFLQNTELIEDAAQIRMRTQEEAQDLLDVFDRALNKLNQRRASIGATTSRLESALNATLITAENLSAARSQILDLDYAAETAEFTRLQILQQAQSSVMQQANISLQIVLGLLRP